MRHAMTSSRLWVPLVVVGIVVWAGLYFFGPAMAGRVAYAMEVGKVEAVRKNLERLSKHDQLSGLFREVAKAVKPAVVEIRVTKKFTTEMPDMEDFFRRFFDDNRMPFRHRRVPAPKKREFFRRGLGSGVVIDAGKGYIMTNYHVVAGANKSEVVLGDGRKLDIEWTRSDPQTDLAIVKVKPERLIDAPLGDSDAVQVGDWVLAIGAPEGLPQTVTAGIISAKGRQDGQPNRYQNFLQTDAAINHGNSGGPLVNMKGQVIGINTAIVSRTGVNEGIGLSIPSNMAGRVMKQLIDHGKVTRGFLGIAFQTVDEKLAKSMGLPGTEGVLVTQVAKGGPADKGGIEAEDFIVSVDGKAITGTQALRHQVANIAPGTRVKIVVYREGKKKTLTVTLALQPKDMTAAFVDRPVGEADLAESYGLKVTTLDPKAAEKAGFKKDATGVLIAEVAEGSAAAEQGLRAGMLITRVGNKDVRTAEEFAAILGDKDAAGGVRLRVADPTGAVRFVFITPKKK